MCLPYPYRGGYNQPYVNWTQQNVMPQWVVVSIRNYGIQIQNAGG